MEFILGVLLGVLVACGNQCVCGDRQLPAVPAPQLIEPTPEAKAATDAEAYRQLGRQLMLQLRNAR